MSGHWRRCVLISMSSSLTDMHRFMEILILNGNATNQLWMQVITEWLFCLNMGPSCLDKPNIKLSMRTQMFVGVVKPSGYIWQLFMLDVLKRMQIFNHTVSVPLLREWIFSRVAQSVGGWKVEGSQFGQNLKHFLVVGGDAFRVLLSFPWASYQTPKCLHRVLEELVTHSVMRPAFTHMYPMTRLLLNIGLKCLHNIMVSYTSFINQFWTVLPWIPILNKTLV